MSDAEPRHAAGASRRRRIVRRIVIGVCVLAVIATAGVVVAYRQLEGNINAVQIDLGTDRPEQVEVEGPQEPLNVLVMGSDDRSGSGIGARKSPRRRQRSASGAVSSHSGRASSSGSGQAVEPRCVAT